MWHFRLQEAQKLSSHAFPVSIRKELSKGRRPKKMGLPGRGTAKASQAGTANRGQARTWQAFPGRELASVPGWDCKHAQAGHGPLASVPKQGTSKRFQAGAALGKRCRQGLQTCPGRALANVPRQGIVDVSRQGTVVDPRQGTVGIPKEH